VNKVVNKSFTPDMLARMLSKGAQHPVQIGNIRTNLYDMFKEHSSITVKSFVKSILSRLKVKLDSSLLELFSSHPTQHE
jgi:hypothetical protein